MNVLNESIKVTIGQCKHDGEFVDLFEKKRIRYSQPSKQLEALFRIIETAKQDKVNFVLAPELFLPRQYLYKHVKSICEENNFVIIGGLEYGPTDEPVYSKMPLTNDAFIAIPSYLGNKLVSEQEMIRNDCTIIEIPKIFPADDEDAFINSQGYTFKNGNRVYIFKSSILGCWAVLICIDFFNLPIQVLLQAEIQTLFVVAYNQDVEAYISASDTVQRLLLCNVVICNIGNYGGSLAFSPFRDRHKRNVYRVIGNHIEAAVSVELPLKKIATEQRGGISQSSTENGNKDKLIKKPPDFGKIKINMSN